MIDVDLTPQCSRCAALCCIALAFDRSEAFACDKPAGEPCQNLSPDFGCAIHADLAEQGFSGCVRFDCYGAGQRVVQEVFNGRTWRDGAAIASRMFDAFRAMRKVHEHLSLLSTTAKLHLTSEQVQQRRDLIAALSPEEGWTPETLAAFETGPLGQRIERFFSSLKTQASGLKRA